MPLAIDVGDAIGRGELHHLLDLGLVGHDRRGSLGETRRLRELAGLEEIICDAGLTERSPAGEIQSGRRVEIQSGRRVDSTRVRAAGCASRSEGFCRTGRRSASPRPIRRSTPPKHAPRARPRAPRTSTSGRARARLQQSRVVSAGYRPYGATRTRNLFRIITVPSAKATSRAPALKVASAAV